MPSGSDDEQIGSGAQFDQRRPSFRFAQGGPDDDIGCDFGHARH
jgi:hypothetical protein